jgi:hypothetical protein
MNVYLPLIRHFLSLVAGSLIARGLATDADLDALAGAILVLFSWGWMFYSKRREAARAASNQPKPQPGTIAALLFAAILLFPAIGCHKVTLAPNGPYKNVELFKLDSAAQTSCEIIEAFLRWEKAYRATLPHDVTNAAGVLRQNTPKGYASYLKVRDAYEAAPATNTWQAVQTALQILSAASLEASTWLNQGVAASPQ